MREKLNADFVSAQRQWERYSEETRLKHEQELSKLRQQVYILEAKVCMCVLVYILVIGVFPMIVTYGSQAISDWLFLLP